MHPTPFRWTTALLIAVSLSTIITTSASPQAATGFYHGRRLKITPKDCTSTKFQNQVGICMFNLECKEKAGVVIGACVDGFLFGACCQVPVVENAELSPVPSPSTPSGLGDRDPSYSPPSRSPPLQTDPGPSEPAPQPPTPEGSHNGSESLSSAPEPVSASPAHVPEFRPVSQALVSLRPAYVLLPTPESPALPPPNLAPTLLPVTLETVTHGSPHSGHSPHRNHAHLHHAHGQRPPVLELEALNPTQAQGLPLLEQDTPRPTIGHDYPILEHDTLRPGHGQRFPALNTAQDQYPSTLEQETVNPTHYSLMLEPETLRPRPTHGQRFPSLIPTIWKVYPGPEQETLRPPGKIHRDTEAFTTDDPVRFSTFMYVDGLPYQNSYDAGAQKIQIVNIGNHLETPTEDVATTTTLPQVDSNENLSGITENVWSLVQQLGSVPVNQVSEEEERLDSDELFNSLVANNLTNSSGGIPESRIPGFPDSSQESGFWKLTTTTSITGGESYSNGNPSANVEPETTTNRIQSTTKPWASSTYQIHTFQYPLTTTTSAPSSTQSALGGLVTWGGVVVNSLFGMGPTKPSTTTEIPKATTTTERITTTLRPRPPPLLTRLTTTTTTTTQESMTTTERHVIRTTTPVTLTTTERLRPTTIPTTTPPQRKKTTPSKVPTKPTTVKPVTKTQKPVPNRISSKEPIDPQSAILQSDLEANLDDFVNQVVQNLAGSLDNLDLDEVILQPPSPSAPVAEGLPPTLHPLHVLSDPLFPPFPLVGQVPLIKPGKTGIGSASNNLKDKPVKKVLATTTSTTTTTTTTTPKPLDYRRDCGVRPLAKSGRIVGGTAAKFGRWPWQALVREATWLGLFSKNKCGGVLISPKYVLTAAHCQPGFLATLTVVLGDFDISSEADTANANSITKSVRRVIVHRDYNAQTFEHDIALLELDSAVEYHPHVVPICLPNSETEVQVGMSAYVTGWGRLKYGGGVPNTLHEVDVPILNNTECQNMFLKSGHIKAIRDSFICAGYANGAKDSCEGDSGGPLAIQRPSGQWILAGTVSHGIKCAYPNLPGVYMRMTYYKAWIKRVTGMSV